MSAKKSADIAKDSTHNEIQWLVPIHLYATLFVLAVAEIVWILAYPLTIISDTKLLIFIQFTIPIAALIIISFKMKAKDAHPIFRPLRFIFEAILILTIGWIILRLFNHIIMTTGFPYQDKLLISWDGYLGSPWLSYFNYVYNNLWLRETLDMAYGSLTPLSAIALFLLLFLGKIRNAQFFIVAFIYTAIASTFIGAFFPALAAVATLIPDFDQYQAFGYAPGTYHIEHLQTLRASAGETIIFLDKMPGLTTFPSFHTSAGIILIASFWRTIIFVPILAYAVLMIASTPVFGGHYFVDLIAGTTLALCVIAMVNRSYRKKYLQK